MKDQNGKSTLLFRKVEKGYEFGTTSIECAADLTMSSVWFPSGIREDRLLNEIARRMNAKIAEKRRRAQALEASKAEKAAVEARKSASSASSKVASMFGSAKRKASSEDGSSDSKKAKVESAKRKASNEDEQSSSKKVKVEVESDHEPEPEPEKASNAFRGPPLPAEDIANAKELGISEAMLRDIVTWTWLGPTMPSGPLARVHRWINIAAKHGRKREEVLRKDFFEYFEQREAEREAARSTDADTANRIDRIAKEEESKPSRKRKLDEDDDEEPILVDEEEEFRRMRELAENQTKRQRENIEFAAWQREHGPHAMALRRIVERSSRLPIPSAPLTMTCSNCDQKPIDQFRECSCSQDWHLCERCNCIYNKTSASCICESL
jgi:hypothetical protein